MRRVAVLLAALVLEVAAAGAEEQVKGWLGVTVEDLAKGDAAKLGFETHGVKVARLATGGPAEKAGLEVGDIIVSLDRVEVETRSVFEADLASRSPGTEVKLGVRRGASEKRIAAMLSVEPAKTAGMAKPILQLDTGGHMVVVKSIAFTPDGKQLVSASEDKTIRVWDLASRKTVRTIRGESASGAAGKIFAMALSRDGKWLAAGGNAPFEGKNYIEVGAIRLYDFASGKLVALLKGHGNVVLALTFSPDGSTLISGSDDKTAILCVRSGVRLAETRLLHRLVGHTDSVYAVGFSADGSRAVTGSHDTELRLWRLADGAQIARMAGHGDKVQSLAVAQDGTIASGDWSGEIRLWDGNNGRFLRTLARQGTSVRSMSFSPDGKLLLLSGNSNAGNPQRAKVYDSASGREVAAYSGHDTIVYATAFSLDGRWAATAGGNNKEIHLWDPRSGSPNLGPDGKPLRLGGQGPTVRAAGFSADGRRIGWGHAGGGVNRGPLQQALTLPLEDSTLGAPVALVDTDDSAFRRASAGHGAWSLAHREGGATLDIVKDGRTVQSIERHAHSGNAHIAYSFTPDGETIISGGWGGLITAYDREGKIRGYFVGHEGDVWALAPSPDGKYLVSGSGDQTVRLWNLKTSELLVTLFSGMDGEWVMWTPQGYYTGSPGADKIVGWQINKGPENTADYVTAEQLRKHLNRPDIVTKAIQLASAEEAVRTSPGTNFKLSDLLARPAPQLRIVSPAQDSAVKMGSAEIKVALAATKDPVTRIRIQVNGRQLDDFLPESGPSFTAGEHSFPVPLVKDKNSIVVTALNEIGWSKIQDGTLTLTHEGGGDLDKQRGTLYILAVGVTQYPGVPDFCRPKRTCDLNFTGKDATAFADAMEKRLGPLHNKTVRRVLVNGGSAKDAPTAANIIDALGVLGDATASDTVAVFLAGHGFNDGPNYRFVSTDAAVSATGALRASSIVPWYAIEEAVDSAKGRRLLFIDTCHSAGAYNQRLGNAVYYANILAYSSARWDQEALERPEYDHGLFTYVLVEGMSGAADLNHDGRVDTAELAEYLRTRVPELAKKFQHEQEPQFFKGRDAETYPLAALH